MPLGDLRVTIRAGTWCARSLFGAPGYRVWRIDGGDPAEWGITFGGTEEEARAAVEAEAAGRFSGTPLRAVMMREKPAAERPMDEACLWCERHGRYSH